MSERVEEPPGFWQSLADVAFPRWCPGCGAWDQFLCPECRRGFEQGIRRVDSRAPYLQMVIPESAGRHGLVRPGDAVSWFPVYSLADYAGTVRKVIVSWKHTVNSGLTREIAGIIEEQCCGLVNGEELGDRRGRARERDIERGAGPVSIVPAPSRKRRHQGLFVAGHLANALAGQIPDAVMDDVLRVAPKGSTGKLQARGVKSQGIHARRAPSAEQVILVDDVLTTGATLAGCGRALAARGTEVIAAVVLAAAPDPRAFLANAASPRPPT